MLVRFRAKPPRSREARLDSEMHVVRVSVSEYNNMTIGSAGGSEVEGADSTGGTDK